MELLPEVEFQADRLLKRRRLKDGQLEVLVKWKGFDDSMNTWEPYESVPDLPHLGSLARLPESPVSESDDEAMEKDDDTFFIEKVLFEWTHPTSKKKTVLIKWQHFPISEVTWEPIDNIMNISGMKEDLLAARKRTLKHFPSQKRKKPKRKADKKEGPAQDSPKQAPLILGSRPDGEGSVRKRRVRRLHSDSESTHSMPAASGVESLREKRMPVLPVETGGKQLDEPVVSGAGHPPTQSAKGEGHQGRKKRRKLLESDPFPESQMQKKIVGVPSSASRHHWTIEVEKVVDGIPMPVESLEREDGYTWTELMGHNVDPDDPAVLESIRLLVRELKRLADQQGPSYALVLGRVQELCEYLTKRQRSGPKLLRSGSVSAAEASLSSSAAPTAATVGPAPTAADSGTTDVRNVLPSASGGIALRRDGQTAGAEQVDGGSRERAEQQVDAAPPTSIRAMSAEPSQTASDEAVPPTEAAATAPSLPSVAAAPSIAQPEHPEMAGATATSAAISVVDSTRRLSSMEESPQRSFATPTNLVRGPVSTGSQETAAPTCEGVAKPNTPAQLSPAPFPSELPTATAGGSASQISVGSPCSLCRQSSVQSAQPEKSSTRVCPMCSGRSQQRNETAEKSAANVVLETGTFVCSPASPQSAEVNKEPVATRARLDQVSAELRKRISQPGLETHVQTALESLRSSVASPTVSNADSASAEVSSPGQLSRQMTEINKQLSRASLETATNSSITAGPVPATDTRRRLFKDRTHAVPPHRPAAQERISGIPSPAADDSARLQLPTRSDQPALPSDPSMDHQPGHRASVQFMISSPGVSARRAPVRPEVVGQTPHMMQRVPSHLLFAPRPLQPAGHHPYGAFVLQSPGYESAPQQTRASLEAQASSLPHLPERQTSDPGGARRHGSPSARRGQSQAPQPVLQQLQQQQQPQNFPRLQRQPSPQTAPILPQMPVIPPQMQRSVIPSGPFPSQQAHRSRHHTQQIPHLVQNQQQHQTQQLYANQVYQQHQQQAQLQRQPPQYPHEAHSRPPSSAIQRRQTNGPYETDSQSYCPPGTQKAPGKQSRAAAPIPPIGAGATVPVPCVPPGATVASRHPPPQNSSVWIARLERLDRRICGVTVKESLLHAKLREVSARSVGGLAIERSAPSSKVRTRMRCYCGPRIERPPREAWVRACTLLRETPYSSSLDEGLECTVCFLRDHSECALAWASSLPSDRLAAQHELVQFIKDYVCVACRVILVEPLAMVDRVLAVAVVQPPPGPLPRQENQKVVTKSVTMEFNLGRSELEELRGGNASLQVRGLLVSPSTLRYSAFPNQVTFYVNAKDNSPAPPECVIRPPAPHRKRKELPWDVPLRMYQGCHNNKLHIICQYSEPNLSKVFMFTVVMVRPVNPKTILHDARTGSQLPNALARSVCRALFAEASRITEDEVQIEQRDSAFLSLRCPSTLMTIGFPARGFHCMHIQCFDLEYFVSSQPRIASHKHRWKCPVCDKPCYPHDLLVDRFCQEILEATTDQDKKVFLTFGDVVSWRVTEREDSDGPGDSGPPTKQEGIPAKQIDNMFKPSSTEGSVIDLD